jgi:hypothetical protein
MNEESRPAERPSRNIIASESRGGCRGQRAWERAVRMFSDDELILCVRTQVAVDRAVNTYRRNAAPPITFEVPPA